MPDAPIVPVAVEVGQPIDVRTLVADPTSEPQIRAATDVVMAQLTAQLAALRSQIAPDPTQAAPPRSA